MKSRFTGCLLGGAVGDALGWPVEFMAWHEILQIYGSPGIESLEQTDGEITDDTQMTLFTAEGLLAARNSGCGNDWKATTIHVYRAYLRWLVTQGFSVPWKGTDNEQYGGLVDIHELYARRAPGGTCISSLCSGTMGSVCIPINDSKGCGGVMRAAPVGLYVAAILAKGHNVGIQDAFKLGCQIAAITHGHQDGYLPAGFLAALIFLLVRNTPLSEALHHLLPILEQYDNSNNFRALLENILQLHSRETIPTPETIEEIGGGWSGAEALAIALFCAVRAGDDFEKGIRWAVNHSGDSDSTGSIAGNIIGGAYGDVVIPQIWQQKLELGSTIKNIAMSLCLAK
jgi:ADP-ribosylglycohydrolase